MILLVDDFDDALEIYGTWLERGGYRVRVARNGREAVVAAQEEPPAIILLDLRMPELDGAAALRQLRSDPRFAQTPIVALTAHAMEEERRGALDAGFDRVVAKPCLPDELAAIVDDILSRTT